MHFLRFLLFSLIVVLAANGKVFPNPDVELDNDFESVYYCEKCAYYACFSLDNVLGYPLAGICWGQKKCGAELYEEVDNPKWAYARCAWKLGWFDALCSVYKE